MRVNGLFVVGVVLGSVLGMSVWGGCGDDSQGNTAVDGAVGLDGSLGPDGSVPPDGYVRPDSAVTPGDGGVIDPPTCSGSTYYVDQSGGDDSNDGLTEAAAWQTLEKVEALTPAPGDCVLLRRGEVWNEGLDISWVGTVANRIYVGPYGAGTAMPRIETTDDGIQAVKLDGAAYVTIDGLEITGNSRYGIWITNDASEITVADSYIHHISVDEEWHCVAISQNAANLRFLGNEIAYCGAEGIYGSSRNIEIGYNHIHHADLMGTVGDVIQLNNVAPNYYVHHNVLDHSNSMGGKGGFICSHREETAGYPESNGLFEYNTVYGGPGDDFGFTTAGLGDVVRYNTITSESGVGFGIKGQVVAHHNIIAGYGSANSCGSDGWTHVIYNNLIMDCGTAVYSRGGGRVPHITFMNNIVLNVDQPLRIYPENDVTASYNLYSSGTTTEVGSVIGAPVFVDAANGDYHLQAGSPGIDQGTDVGLTLDRDGVAIPQGGAPDIGPYEQ